MPLSATNLHLIGISGLVVDATTGNLLVSMTDGYIAIISQGGQLTGVLGDGSGNLPKPGKLNTYANVGFPEFIDVDSAGNIYFGEFADLYRKDALTGAISHLISAPGIRDIAVDGQGDVYFVSAKTRLGNTAIFKWNAFTGAKTLVNSGVQSPEHISIASNGGIYVTSNASTAPQIYKLASIAAPFVNVAAAQDAGGLGASINVATATGQTVSNVRFVAGITPPAGVSFPAGVISYQVSVPMGSNTATTSINFSSAFPAVIDLYKVDSAGNSTLIPTTRWIRLNNNGSFKF